jgi:hypothetical protein
MICPFCRRDVEFVKASYWHGDANICRECLAQWHDPDNDQVGASDPVSIGNPVRLRHGLPPLAVALAVLLTFTPPAQASRHCLDRVEAARTWPNRALTQDGDRCWTYDRRPPPLEAAVSISEEPPATARDPTLGEWWLESELVLAELQQLEVERTSRGGPPSPEGPNLAIRHLALFVALVLATVSVLEVATWRPGQQTWPRWRTPRREDEN